MSKKVTKKSVKPAKKAASKKAVAMNIIKHKRVVLDLHPALLTLSTPNSSIVAIVLPCNFNLYTPEDSSTLILDFRKVSLLKNLLTASFVIFLI